MMVTMQDRNTGKDEKLVMLNTEFCFSFSSFYFYKSWNMEFLGMLSKSKCKEKLYLKKFLMFWKGAQFELLPKLISYLVHFSNPNPNKKNLP